jgi:hypothetical protein
MGQSTGIAIGGLTIVLGVTMGYRLALSLAPVAAAFGGPA